MRVLVVEDNADLAAQLRDALVGRISPWTSRPTGRSALPRRDRAL